MYRSIFLSATLLLAIIFSVKAQKIDGSLNRYADALTSEYIYVHFDKAAYSPGETIWFKAYLRSGFAPSEISKNFYMDWCDADGRIIQHTTAPIVESSANGQFDIPENFKGKSIYVRAYTQWMQNFDSTFLFNKELLVIQKNTTPKTAIDKRSIDLQFLPEGGTLVTDIKSKVAFKATDQWGNPSEVKGAILNSKGEKVDTIRSIHDGMGYNFLTPAAGESYSARWTDETGKKHITPLPQASDTGATINISSGNNKLTFSIHRPTNVPENLKVLNVMATIDQQMIYRARIDLRNTITTGGSIPTESLPTSIVQVTLFDADWLPIAERICFVNNNDYSFSPEIEIVSDTRKRAKNFIDIDVPDTVTTNMSISVTDEAAMTDNKDNIISHFLLSGQLKGIVNNPAYYFSSNADSIKQHLDLVMLTNGWRKIDWEAIAKDQIPSLKYPKDTSYLSFSGKVFGATKALIKEAAEITILYQGNDSRTNVMALPLLPDGSFYSPGMVFFDTLNVFYQFSKRRDLATRTAVTFTNGLLPTPAKLYALLPTYSPVQLDTLGATKARLLADQRARLEQLLKTTTLESVTVTTRQKKPLELLDEKYASGLFKGDGRQFDIANDIAAQSAQSVFTYLQGRVAGLNINATGPEATATWRGSKTSFFLDEMNVEAQQLENIPMTDIAYVKVFQPPFFGAIGGGSGGAIAVYTNKGGSTKGDSEGGLGLDKKKVIGYSQYKQFYSPNYSVINTEFNKPDYRTTLYWNPYIMTDPKKHRVSLEFYNNDISKKLRIVLTGVNKDGKLTYIEKIVE